MMRKAYYRLTELTDEWSAEDLFHHFIHGRIRLGIALHGAIMHGLNADLQTVGIYMVTGVVTIPTKGAEQWELGGNEPAEVGGVMVEKDYPPEIRPASFLDESEFPPLMPWAPGRDWDHPEEDHARIERFMVSDDRWIIVKKSDVVIHEVERQRIASGWMPIPGPDDASPGKDLVFDSRIQALKDWLEQEQIPEADWPYLKSRRGFTTRLLYAGLSQYPAFKSQHGRGKAITFSTFRRTFWASQDIASLD